MAPTLQLALLLLLPLFFLFAERSRRRRRNAAAISNKVNPLPPSPPTLPFIGNLHQLSSTPHRSLCQLSKKYGPLMLLHLGFIPTLIVSSASAAQEILRTQDLLFASRPSLKTARILLRSFTDMAFAPYGECWRQLRKISATHLLSVKMVQSFGEVRAEEVALLMEKIALSSSTSKNGGVVCLSEILNSLSSNVLCKCLLGSSMSDDRRKLLIELIRKNMKFFGSVFFEDNFPGLRWLDVVLGWEGQLKKHSEDWDIILEELVEERIRWSKEGDEGKNGTNFIDVMLQVQKDSTIPFAFTKGHIKAIVQDLLVAGTDTSYVVLEWSMAELIRNPDIMQKAQKEVREAACGEDAVTEEHLAKLTYLKAIIKEVLRMHPPIPILLPRESLQDSDIQGYTIPKGTRVLVNAWAIGRDESYWESPQEFRPERFLCNAMDFKGNDFRYIPFGAGRRICPGIQFAAGIVELALANLLNRFDWELPSGVSRENMNLEDGNGLIVSIRGMLALVPIDMKVKAIL